MSARKSRLAAADAAASPPPRWCSAASAPGLFSLPLTGLVGLVWGVPLGALCAESRPIPQAARPWASEQTSLNFFSVRSVDGGLKGLSVCT